MVPDLGQFSLQFFKCAMMQKQYVFSRNPTSKFEFSSFLELAIYVVQYSLMMLGSGCEKLLPNCRLM